MDCFLRLLFSPDLFCIVSDYQHGTYHRKHPLRRLPTPRIRRGIIFEEWAKEDMARVDAVLAHWYSVHGLDRMSYLLRFVPRQVVAVHATYFGHMRVFHALLQLVPLESISDSLIDWAAFHGELPMIHVLDTFFSHAPKRTHLIRMGSALAIDLAATEGHMQVVLWLHETAQWRHKCSVHAMDGAARNGHLDVVQWLHAQGYACTSKAVDDASRNGHMSVVEWLTALGIPATKAAMNGAAAAGHLTMVQYLHRHRKEGCTREAMDAAARGGHLPTVQWLHQHRREGCTVEAIDGAARHGHVHVVEWLLAHRQEG
ncbi:hypothetical protein As57867_006820, partial [Aphanomyces stellatus]